MKHMSFMLFLSDLQNETIPNQLFAFSDAYLESAESLCTKLCDTLDQATYAHGAVIMSLTFHSLELFFKAAILRKAPSETFTGRNGHDLDKLYKRYSKLYPRKAMQFYIPFNRELPNTNDWDPVVAQKLLELDKAMPEDQLHRYPVSGDGAEWKAVLAFEPHTFIQTIRKLRRDIESVKTLLEGSRTTACDKIKPLD